MAQISFFINGTMYDPAPLPFRHWWYPELPQQPFIRDLVLLSQQGLGPGTHELTIQYAIDTTLGLPQVVLAFDRLEVTYVGLLLLISVGLLSAPARFKAPQLVN